MHLLIPNIVKSGEVTKALPDFVFIDIAAGETAPNRLSLPDFFLTELGLLL